MAVYIEKTEEEVVRDDFAAGFAGDPDSLVSEYHFLFGSVLSTRLACELSSFYRQSNQARGRFRQHVTETARKITRRAWLKLISQESSGLPVVLVVGGGPGSGTHTAVGDANQILGKEASIIYDAAGEAFETVDQLVREAHAKGLTVVAAFVHRPLESAARADIHRSLRERQSPDVVSFARGHVRAADTLRRLEEKYSKHKQLFASTVILNPGDADEIDTTTHGFSATQTLCTPAQALESFYQVLDAIKAGGPTETRDNDRNRRPSRMSAPRRGKSLAKKAERIGYLLARALRQQILNLKPAEDPNQPSLLALIEPQSENEASVHILAAVVQKEEATRETQPQPEPQVKEQPTQPGDPPILELVHQRAHGSKAENEKATHLHEKTITGQEELLDEERPEHLVAQQRIDAPYMQEMVRTR